MLYKKVKYVIDLLLEMESFSNFVEILFHNDFFKNNQFLSFYSYEVIVFFQHIRRKWRVQITNYLFEIQINVFTGSIVLFQNGVLF